MSRSRRNDLALRTAGRSQFDPQAGHEESGKRPALVLSPSAYNGRVGLALLCPITSRQKGYPFEVALPAGLRIVLADPVRSLDWRLSREGGEEAQLDERSLATRPPRCLGELVTTPCAKPRMRFDGHGSSLNTYFELACSCGGGTHTILGYPRRNPDAGNASVFLSPLSLRCGTCGRVAALIDTSKDGHDAELGLTGSLRGEGQAVEYECAKCGRQDFSLVVRLEYPDDLLDQDDEEFRGREQDLFSWFTLVARCHGCGVLQAASDFECAWEADAAGKAQVGTRTAS